MNNQAEKFKTSDKKKKRLALKIRKLIGVGGDEGLDSVHSPPWWSGSASLDGCVWGCQSRNIIPQGRQQTNWVTKTISSSGNPSFNSPCAESLIREFTSNAFSEGQVHHLYLIYLTWCKYCWSFTVDLVRPHFSEVHPRIKLLNTAAICRWSGAMQITDTFVPYENKVTHAVHFMCFSLCSLSQIIFNLFYLRCVCCNYFSLHFG